MARRGNLFAVLDGEEGEEVSILIESIAAKVKVSSRPSTAERNGQKYPPPDSVRADRRGGNGGYGFYAKRYNGNDAEQFVNSHPNGYGSENGRADGYRYRAKGRADGYWYRAKRGDDGDRNGEKGPDGDCQDNGLADGDEGWVEVYRNKEGRPFHDDMQFTRRNRNYRGERTRYYADNRVPRSRTVHETKEDADNDITSGDNSNAGTEGNGSVTTKVSEEENQQRKHTDEEQRRKEERKREKEAYEERKRQREEDAKKMTLKQYEDIIEKNKALGFSKSQERKVTLDKDFESMHVVTKNKEGDIFIKLNSDKDKLKKKDSVGKAIKISKTLSIDEFLIQREEEEAKKKRRLIEKADAEWQKREMQRGGYGGRDVRRRDGSSVVGRRDGCRDGGRRDDGRNGGRRDDGRNGGSDGELESAPAVKSPPPPIEDLHLFPTLCKVAKLRT